MDRPGTNPLPAPPAVGSLRGLRLSSDRRLLRIDLLGNRAVPEGAGGWHELAVVMGPGVPVPPDVAPLTPTTRSSSRSSSVLPPTDKRRNCSSLRSIDSIQIGVYRNMRSMRYGMRGKFAYIATRSKTICSQVAAPKRPASFKNGCYPYKALYGPLNNYWKVLLVQGVKCPLLQCSKSCRVAFTTLWLSRKNLFHFQWFSYHVFRVSRLLINILKIFYRMDFFSKLRVAGSALKYWQI